MNNKKVANFRHKVTLTHTNFARQIPKTDAGCGSLIYQRRDDI